MTCTTGLLADADELGQRVTRRDPAVGMRVESKRGWAGRVISVGDAEIGIESTSVALTATCHRDAFDSAVRTGELAILPPEEAVEPTAIPLADLPAYIESLHSRVAAAEARAAVAEARLSDVMAHGLDAAGAGQCELPYLEAMRQIAAGTRLPVD